MANWSREEVEAIVADYLSMLEAERREEEFNKTEHRKGLSRHLNKRSRGSIERKHMNISAVMLELGVPPIDGYKPLGNYQQLLFEVVENEIDKRPSLLEAVAADVRRDTSLPSIDDILNAKVSPPKPRPGLKLAYPRRVSEAPRVRLGVNYLAMEAANARLSANGEEFILRYERERLLRQRLDHLAKKVERLSVTKGDGMGYDILSFEKSGAERLIEVKTTKYGWYTPFYATRNEVMTSRKREGEYHLYRVFDFRKDPHFFFKRGNLEHEFSLDPVQYEARIA